MRKLVGETLLIATHNQGKLAEFEALFAPFGTKVISAGALGLEEPVETETSFRGNAQLKAEAASLATGLITLADDSGLAVTALGGEPGVYTADWAGVPRDWMRAMTRVEQALALKGALLPEQRGATFLCTLCVRWPDGELVFFEGEVAGTLVWPPRGVQGHGYDPMFMPQPYRETFAELDPALKNKISHRAQALQKLCDALF